MRPLSPVLGILEISSSALINNRCVFYFQSHFDNTSSERNIFTLSNTAFKPPSTSPLACANMAANGHTGQIPVIDISGSQPESQVAKELVDAAATYGFVYVKNEGNDIPIKDIDHTFELARESHRDAVGSLLMRG